MNTVIHPSAAYTLEVSPPREPGGSWHWTIRHRGKLFQRSDRKLTTEDRARESGEAEIAKLIMGR